MILFGKIAKYAGAVLALFGTAGYGRVLSSQFFRLLENPGPLFVFASGIMAFTLLWVFFLARRGSFWSTLEHELTHALFAILFFKKINSISATRKKGGVIAIEGGNAIIALSPYFFPLAATIVLLIKFVLPASYQIYAVFFLGFTYQFHVISLIREFHLGQSDLHLAGPVFSIIFIFFTNILFLGLILTVLSGDWKDAIAYLWNGFMLSLNYLQDAWTLVFDTVGIYFVKLI
ncbi:MAG: hypothetical protein EH225_12145 [Calditrichaeota bacterium]|nr:hypothetical protein [Calditrichota bacterium]RQV99097.1 MAG: hypothetical protein EH225_12145 [Calditrichota bacterium]